METRSDENGIAFWMLLKVLHLENTARADYSMWFSIGTKTILLSPIETLMT